jgi:hypothetical protein
MKTSLFLLCLLGVVLATEAPAQDRDCKFLNEDCGDPVKQTKPSDTRPQLTDEQHLERCLSDYRQRQGGFAPEGHSTSCMNGRTCVKSLSDATAMCKWAIERKNFYWDLARNLDQEANFRCCTKMGGDSNSCSTSIKMSNYDYCDALHRANDPPPAEWKVPAGCTAGPCLTTPEYCKAVGYSALKGAARASMIATFRQQIRKYPQTADSFRTVLRVCFGTN